MAGHEWNFGCLLVDGAVGDICVLCLNSVHVCALSLLVVPNHVRCQLNMAVLYAFGA